MRKIDKFKIGSKPKTAIEDTIKRESLNGRISTAMTGNLASERLPSIFDAKEITERDKALLKEVKEWDVILGIDRRSKPVILSNFETRLIYALSFEISKELTTSSDVKSKVKNALSKGNPIKRTILVSELSKLIFGSKKKTYKDKIFNGLLKLSKLRQIVTITKENGAKIRLTAPLILIGETYEVLSEDSNTDTIEIIYGSTFFHRLEERYAVITPLLFEVWRVLGLSAAIVIVIMLVMNLLSGNGLDGVTGAFTTGVIVLAILMVLSLPAYWIVTKANNGKYTVLFEMDEEGIDHTQIKTDKAKALEALTILAGTKAGNRTVTGAGVLSATGTSLYSRFSSVKKIKADPSKCLIRLYGKLIRNQVYTDPEHYEFVLGYITERCPQAEVTRK